MKKLFALFVAAGILAFMACGGGADKEKEQKIKDSLKKDSIAKVEKDKAKADSIAKVEKDKAKEDSINNIEGNKDPKGNNPKPKTEPVKNPNVTPNTAPDHKK